MDPHQPPTTNTNGFGPHHSSPAAGPSTPQAQSTPSQYLPRQVFSSPTDNPYPASTLAAVEATRARFFARQSGTSTSIQSAPRPRTRIRPTLTGSTSLSETRIRTHKTQPLSSSSSSAYRQSFFERCQRAMDDSRSMERQKRVCAFRRGKDGFTSGLFSDEMDVEDDEYDSGASSPPGFQGEEDAREREEDNELTRRKIIAEYSRLKRIYELKGHLEIGWIDPDQLSWLENEAKQQQEEKQGGGWEGEEVVDPYWGANDEQLEQLWIESMSQTQHLPQQAENGGGVGDVEMMMDQDGRDEWEEDAAFEEALARLPV
ncbi:uncharacterized protein UTRI_01001_B [Ustilago trichophora]|uniref:Uncharacterized protein n=1 Tax=Ustilago trichophora TaxID=86804 RepID=A0A5C3DSW1_9BASI|nr:uncharacterized protein UTRI_01001_B [Ustilago trichophora]